MVGQRIGAYEVLSRLGEGGMGVVYKALDTRLQRYVALKALPADVAANDVLRRRFLQEARAASALNDAHIITIHDVLSEGGKDYLVMEFVEGRTLRDVVKAGPSPIDRALDWVAQIADALALAHAAGIIHRDLKPGNVMVTERGLIKVLDFGIAKVTRGGDEDPTAAAMTRAGDLLGTIEYMSPEQARGGVIDHRSDIFSLGAILYELLTGTRPFRAANPVALLHAVLYEPIAPVRAHRPEIPAAVEEIAVRALDRDAERRFQSMADLAAAVRAALADHAPRAAAEPRPAARRDRRWLWGLAAIVVLAAAIVGLPRFRAVGTRLAGDATPARSEMPAPADVRAPATAFEHTQVGLGLLQRFDRPGHVDRAIASFESAITLDKSFAPAWAGLARAYWRRQRVTSDKAWSARAIDAAREAVKLDPYLAAGHVSLGYAHLAAPDRAAAKASLDHALVLDPNNADAYRGLGDLAEGEGRLPDAAGHFAKAVSLNPQDAEFPRLAGTIAYRTGRYTDAKSWYEKSAAVAPDSAVPFSLLGAANHMLGDYGAAASAFQKSIAIQPTANGYTNLGTALFYQGMYRESLPAFETAVNMSPTSPVMWGNMADAYRWVPGNKARAAEAYRRAIQLLDEQLAKDPSHAQHRSRLAVFLAKSGDRKRALIELGRVLTTDVRDLNMLYRAAVTYELCGSRDAALSTLQRALERGYALTEVRVDPELTDLRNDVRYHRLAARFQNTTETK